MNTAVVLTYPGHWMMTNLCLSSIHTWYPEIQSITVLYDDLASKAWPTYAQDCQDLYGKLPILVQCRPYSDLTGVSQCDVGWWRAQLIKLHTDCMVPGNSWLVVDGDVIFDQYIDPSGVTPYAVRHGEIDLLNHMVTRYVETMLGKSKVRLSDIQKQHIITSSIPFRVLERDQLQDLRGHVESEIGGNFLQRHCEMFDQQKIVGWVPEGDRMVMHEWELIESYNQMIAPDRYTMRDVGSGYHTFTHTNYTKVGWRFRHSSLTDAEVGRDWFAHQNLHVTDAQWQRCMEVHQAHA